MRHSNLHTHTVFSDGKNTPREMAERAEELGFASLGFSEHSETDFYPGDCMNHSLYPIYRQTVDALKEEWEGVMDLYCGIEKDLYSEIAPEDFDYVIGSVHYLQTPDGFSPIDYSLKRQMEYVEHYGKGDPLEYAKRYYESVVHHTERCPYTIQGHFDLVNKFGLFDGAGEAYQRVALEAMDAVLERIPFIEVNTGAIARGYRTEPYPEDFLLAHLKKRGARLVINGDSHRLEHLRFHFDETVEKLKKYGFSSVWQLRDNAFCQVEL